MAHFSELDENNIVLRVVVVNNDVILDSNNNESEQLGIDFCKGLFGNDTTWKQTSYNATFRKNYGCIGSTYDADKDAFINEQPFDSWTLNETTCKWEAPIPMPEDKNTVAYSWNENDYQADNTTGWQQLTID